METDLNSIESSEPEDSGEDWGKGDVGRDAESIIDDSDDDASESETTVYSSQSESRNEEKEIGKIIRKETEDVHMWREIVTGMLVITAVLVTVTTYIFLSRAEVQQFATGFYDGARALKDSTAYNFRTLSDSMDAFGDLMTSYAMASGSVWPFVTVHNFDTHAQHVRYVAGIDVVWIAPLVSSSQRADWEAYAVNMTNNTIYPSIFDLVMNTTIMPSSGPGPFAPFWQAYPEPESFVLGRAPPENFDMFSESDYAEMAKAALVLQDIVYSDTSDNIFRHLVNRSNREEPAIMVVEPVFSRIIEKFAPEEQRGEIQDAQVVGFVHAIYPWTSALLFQTNHSNPGIDVVVRSTCGDLFTYTTTGTNITYVGEGDLHSILYSDFNESATFSPYLFETETAIETGSCVYSIDVYPTDALRESYKTNKPQVYTAIIATIFFLMAFTFFAYDQFVQRRNLKIIDAAARSNAIVSSLFPSNIRDRMLGQDSSEENKSKSWMAPKSGLKNFLQEEAREGEGGIMYQSRPLADLFPNTTIMFADLVGFTAWSSVREPSQVFTLLETVYRAFDQIARRRRIFKVETVGDCYVAVAGLPEKRADHAVAIAKYASYCLKQVRELTKKMEVVLGPDTGDLTVRIGIHSGPVIAGVLRGDKSRFQLFGDTMNTASRMESTGIGDRIQVSQETADLLIASGKGNWVKAREEKISAKGKGEMQTYWLHIENNSDPASSARDTDSVVSDSNDRPGQDGDYNTQQECVVGADTKVKRLMAEKTKRLIDWNVEVLARLLKQIIARRNANPSVIVDSLQPLGRAEGCTVLDEVKEIISLPEFDVKTAWHKDNPDGLELDKKVHDQLVEYVTNVAILYHENPFHNFEHASHVVMSVAKLLSRIVAPSELLGDYDEGRRRKSSKLASSLHDHTYGITSDPLTQFACVLSALIHDVDHKGVPNTQLIKEDPCIAAIYNSKSVAEQNSVDLSWELLMHSCYIDLRNAICASNDEFKRFRQLVVNVVMATDIMDKDLKALRNARWDRAFTENTTNENPRDKINRKATIVIEHLIQASDVSHTMQHWHVYRKWNERFFMECYRAFKDGRAQSDPSESWYKGEMGFFDFYIIPLAKKLNDCGVFGVSSDEYLNYALKNRQEWEIRGQEVVAEMMETASQELATEKLITSTSARSIVRSEAEGEDLSIKLPKENSKTRGMNELDSATSVATSSISQGEMGD